MRESGKDLTRREGKVRTTGSIGEVKTLQCAKERQTLNKEEGKGKDAIGHMGEVKAQQGAWER